jgi:HD-GYP domain-containing protein (c-di-GMP phosphodiesterase class II)
MTTQTATNGARTGRRSRREREPLPIWLVLLQFVVTLAVVGAVASLALFVSITAALAGLYVTLILIIFRMATILLGRNSDLRDRSNQLKTSYDSIVAVLCAALDLRDNVTLGHAKRVSEIASVLAYQMGLRKEQLRQIESAAILHDIGKIGVADAVLSKAGPLNEEEWLEMKRHPELGFQVLSGIDFLADAAEVVYAHHERFDGSGYPRGLKGDDIPLGARVFAVVDAYEAMTSHRPYRKALPHYKAVEEIKRNAGTQFDPEIVRAFMDAERRGLLHEGAEDPDAHPGVADLVEHATRTLTPAGE